jgi:beta-galactosidase/beta-glucuronidase
VAPNSQAPVHPRPQLTRSRWVELAGDWQFAYDDDRVGISQGWHCDASAFDRTICVPFPPESPASGIGDQGFHPVLWYRTTFRPRSQPGERLLLHFDAVDYRAQVWVNGQFVVEHVGGHTPFSADVTEMLDGTGEQVLVVRAEDDPHDLEMPRGKQDWEKEPHGIWYPRTSGIWQTVWLEPVPALRIEEVRWTPDVAAAALHLELRLDQVPAHPHRARLVLSRAGRQVADSVVAFDRDRAWLTVRLPQADMTLERQSTLWSPETPNLFDAEITLLDGDIVRDTVGSYVGLRSISTADNRVYLNGRPYFFRLVLDQCYWAESHMSAPNDEAIRRDVELVKDLGFNGVRLHQKVADPRFLYWCDHLGLLVWSEMPAAYEFSARAIERTTAEWTAVVRRSSSHPCVIAWVPVNESWGVPNLVDSAPQRAFVSALYHLTKALDPDRLVVGNDGWEQVVTDVITVHDYTFHPEVLRGRYGREVDIDATLSSTQPGYRSVLLPGVARHGQALMVTEFGGITFDVGVDADGDGNRDGSSWHGYSQVYSADELLERYRGLVDALLDAPAIAGFCYTQLTDTFQETNGLLTADRRPKADMAELRRINRRPSAAVPADEVGSFEFGDYPPTVMDRGSDAR